MVEGITSYNPDVPYCSDIGLSALTGTTTQRTVTSTTSHTTSLPYCKRSRNICPLFVPERAGYAQARCQLGHQGQEVGGHPRERSGLLGTSAGQNAGSTRETFHVCSHALTQTSAVWDVSCSLMDNDKC
jgi:hypothetical protein